MATTSASIDAKRGTEKGPVLGVDYAGEFPTYTAGPSSPTKPQHAILDAFATVDDSTTLDQLLQRLEHRDNGAAAGYVPSVPLSQ